MTENKSLSWLFSSEEQNSFLYVFLYYLTTFCLQKSAFSGTDSLIKVQINLPAMYQLIPTDIITDITDLSLKEKKNPNKKT